MYKYLAPHVHIAELRGCFVVLDTRRDRYVPLSRAQSDALRQLLGGSPSYTSHVAAASAYAELFEQCGIVCSKPSQSHPLCCRPEDTDPVQPFEGWHVRPEDFDQIAPVHKVLLALHVLHRVHRKMQKTRLHGLMQWVEQLHDSGNTHYRPVSDYAIHVAALNRACMVYPRRTECLAWTVALILLAGREGDRLDLVLGVARSPFHAHAWAEVQGAVIGDHPDRRKQLAVICEVGASTASYGVPLNPGGA